MKILHDIKTIFYVSSHHAWPDDGTRRQLNPKQKEKYLTRDQVYQYERKKNSTHIVVSPSMEEKSPPYGSNVDHIMWGKVYPLD